MEEHSTYPALLAAQTVPVPLPEQPPASSAQPHAAAWPGLVIKLAAAGLGLWLLKSWW